MNSETELFKSMNSEVRQIPVTDRKTEPLTPDQIRVFKAVKAIRKHQLMGFAPYVNKLTKRQIDTILRISKGIEGKKKKD
jgi:hypothetical protein